MFIESPLVYLRAIEPKDINVLYEWENDLKLWPVSFTQIPFSKFILEEFVKNKNSIYRISDKRINHHHGFIERSTDPAKFAVSSISQCCEHPSFRKGCLADG
jgi:hypothetical protein